MKCVKSVRFSITQFLKRMKTGGLTEEGQKTKTSVRRNASYGTQNTGAGSVREMSLTDRVLQLATLVILCITLVVTEIYSLRVKNLERMLKAESSALRYEVKETEERCRRLSYTCIDVVNRKILEGGNYGEDEW